jgi:hypothetical protein
MKKILLFLLVAFFSTNLYSQSIVIDNVTASPTSGGINVSLNTISYSGAGYLADSFTINQNVVTLNVCYWFNNTLPVLTFHHDIFIPVSFSYANYTLVVNIHNSISNTACDYFSMTDTETLAVLSNADFTLAKNNFALYPNPTSGDVNLKTNGLHVSRISVYDNLGRMVKNIPQKDANYFSINDLNDGIYLVNLETENGTFSQKMIVKK